MGLIVHQRNVTHAVSFDLIEQYSKENDTEVISVKLWGFERLSVGQVSVRWGNGAVGSYFAANLSEIHDRVAGLSGWPKPILYHRTLPHSAGLLLLSDTAVSSQNKEQAEMQDAAKLADREPPCPPRRRRVRSGNSL